MEWLCFFYFPRLTHVDFNFFFAWAHHFVLHPPQGLGIMSNGVLPNHSSAVQEKLHRANGSASWTRPVLLPIPGVRTRRLRLYVPNVTSFSQIRGSRVRRSRGPLLLCITCMALILTVMILRSQSSRQWTENWPPSIGESSTLVFRREDLQRIWKWEIASGHFPSRMTSTWLFSNGQISPL
jgi:WD repeat and SOF domain-containing protein 1